MTVLRRLLVQLTIVTLVAGVLAALTGGGTSAAAGTGASPRAQSVGQPKLPGGSLVTVTPQRVADTRPTGPVTNLRLSLGSRVATGSVAAVLGVTVVSPSRTGYLTAYPDGADIPSAASLSFAAGHTVTATVIANLSNPADLAIRVAVPANLIVDLLGYFTDRETATAAGSYHPVTAQRIADTRHNLGARPLPAGGTESVQLAGVAGIPGTGVTAVAVNLVVVGATANSYLTAYPDGQPAPHSASVSFGPGQVVAERAVVAVANGRIAVHNIAGTTQFVVEVVGYFGDAAGGGYFHVLQNTFPYVGDSVARVYDSRQQSPHLRTGMTSVDQGATSQTVEGFAPWDSTVPPIALIATFTVFGQQGTGGITTYPYDTTPPATTDLAYGSSSQGSNQVMPGLTRGAFSFRVSGAATEVVVDVTGYFVRQVVATSAGVWGWGSNELGRPGLTSSSAPVNVPMPGRVIALSQGSSYATYAVLDDHTVWGWGDGQFGAGRQWISAPGRVPGATSVVAVAANGPGDGRGGTAYALRSDGTVLAWGQNLRGELGDGTTTARNAPATIAGLTSVTQVAAGYENAYALTSDGTVWAWGDNSAGQLGQGTATGYQARPTQVPGLSGVTSIEADENEAWAVHADGSLSQWGRSGMPQAPSPALSPTTPSWVQGACPARRVAAAGEGGAVLCADGTVWAWHQYFAGDDPGLARGETIPGLTGVTDLIAQGTAAFAVTASGTVWRWGMEYYNSLGDGYEENSGCCHWPFDLTEPSPMPEFSGARLLGSYQLGTFVLRG